MIGVLGGTFTRPMKSKDGRTIAPTGRAFRVPMVTVAHWNAAGRMDHEWVFSDDNVLLKQIGIAR